MTIDTKALLPCPFCKSDQLAVTRSPVGANVTCLDCGACGPHSETHAEDWNLVTDRIARIEQLAATGTAQAFAALPDEDKLRWWVISGQRDQEQSARLAALEEQLHLANIDALQTEAERAELEAENQRLRDLIERAISISSEEYDDWLDDAEEALAAGGAE